MEVAADNDRVTALVASLSSGFGGVHLSAIPSMMDCILSSIGTSPSLLFDSLLGPFADVFEEVGNEECTMDTKKCKYISARFCAISHLVKDIGAHGDRFQTYVWKAFVPSTKKVHIVDQELLRQIITLFLDVVVETDAWKDLGISLVPFLLRSMRVPTEIGRISRFDGEDGNYVVHNCLDESTSSTTVEIENTNGLPPPGYIELSLSCHILSEMLDAALSSGEHPPARLSISVDKFVCDLLHNLCIVAEQLLLQSLEYRSSAISILLPVIFKAFTSEVILRSLIQGQTFSVFWRHFPEKIWNCSRKMFSLGYLERRDAYRVLSLYLSFSESTETSKHDYIKGQMGEFDIRDDKEFWDEIKRGLVDKDALLRKQALHMLKGALGKKDENQEYPGTSGRKSEEKHSSTQTLTRRELWAAKEAQSLGVGRESELSESGLNNQQMWGAFLLLYEMLEEYGTHLVEAAWNHQVSSLLHFSNSNNSLESCNCDAEIQNKIILSELPVWLAILWEREFHHDNPQVRCLILESFLSIDWSKFGLCVIALDESFVLGPFIQGLNDPVHHEDFGIKGVYSSIILEGAARFFFHYTGHLDVRRQIALLKNLASLAKQQSFSRAGLMTLSECIASVGCRTSLDNEIELGMLHNAQSYNGQVESSLEASSDHHCTDLLDALRYVVESCKQHFNPNYRLQVCQKILEVAVSVVCPESVPLEMLLHFVSAFPSEFTDYGGSLRITLQQWISGGRTKCSCRTCKDGGIGLLKSLYRFPAEFVSTLYVGQSSFVCDDEELAAWEGEANRWVMVLFLVSNDKDIFDPLCSFIYDYGTRICEEKKISQWQTIKYLILLLRVACQLQLLSDKVSDSCADPRRKLPFGCLLDTLNGTYQKFLQLFSSIMENLVLYAKVSCPVLWSPFELEETKLPSSVRGKLGGPSQRRLSSEMTSSVLQAKQVFPLEICMSFPEKSRIIYLIEITSMKVISSLSSWCKKFGTNVSVDFAFDFFWDFLWRTLSSSACNSETEAEIGLAAYETLTPVLRTLASTYTSLSLDHIAKQHNPVAADMEDEPLLDALVKKFLQNINWLLEVGYLARSRKAALMKFKWHCLESLLSIPNLALKSGYKPTRYKSYFSDDVVRQTFAELVENLENAAEDAVLPMLRSIRLVHALFTSRSDILVSSCGGVNIQDHSIDKEFERAIWKQKMIWQLVQSSWILHVSCNKRRVAAIGALLSSVLHPSYFSDETMHMINGASGPLKWFVEKVLEEGTKSPRTIRLAALHLTGLWLTYPRILKYYIKELKLLSLHGSVAFDEDFEGELVDNIDAKAEVSLLAMSPEPELTKAFINTELYARVSVAALFQKLADLAENDALLDIHDDKRAACEAGRLFLLELLNSVVNEKDLAKELYKKYSAIHRRKIRAWQMICGLSRFVCEDILDQVTNSLHISLYLNNLPAVRQYLETFAINVYLKFPLLVKEQLVPILQDYNTKPQALSSYVFIAANIILHAPDQLKSKHLDDLLPPIIPLLTSHHHSLRGFTQLLVYKVLHKLFPPSSVGATQYISLEERCFENLREYLSKNSDCMRLRASMEGYLDSYDPVISATPAGIFVNRVEDLQFECVPTSLMEEVLTFLNAVREDLRCSMAKDLATIKSEILRLGEDKSNSDLSCDDKNDVILSQPPANASANFQKKFTLSKHEKQESGLHTSLGFSDLYQQTLGEMEKDDQLLDQSLQSRIMTMGKVRASRQQIILVASLLDRIPNLAGLARTCEVFKASGLAIADTSVLQDKQFQLISVTAEKWVPIIEIPVKSLIGFLEKKRREGFSILGLEQTANSVRLNEFVFPEKTVLVLGREKEGIPVEIIHILDACIEIPQLGIVRSLNVHVSGAVALWEYTRQHRSC